MRRHSVYHKILRTSAVVVAFVLAFESGAISKDTRALSLSTHSYLAQVVGMSAAVNPNELNVLTAEITALESELARREREIDARARDNALANSPYTIYILSAILVLQLALIVANYAFDFYRERKRQTTALV